METWNFSNRAFLIYAIAIAAFLPYLPFMAIAVARLQEGYDSHAPRAMFDKLPPYAQRATWAHQNTFENVGIFVAAALTAYVTGVDSILVRYAVLAFVSARIIYPFCYIFDLPIARSFMFAVGNLANVVLFGLAIMQINQAI